jgi:hypothetical protein
MPGRLKGQMPAQVMTDLHDDPGRDAGRGQQGGSPVSGVVETDDAYSGVRSYPGEGPVHVARLDRVPGAGSEVRPGAA